MEKGEAKLCLKIWNRKSKRGTLLIASLFLAINIIFTLLAFAGVTLHDKDDFKFDVSAQLRLQANGYYNFDMNDDVKQDETNDFLTARSWLGFDAKYKTVGARFALDIAGDDFNDGVLLGNDNPGKQRKWETKVQELYITWKGFLFIQAGRQKGHLGNGIVAHIKRDAVKIVKKIDQLKIVGVWVKGGEGQTQDKGIAGPSETPGDQNDNQSGVPVNAENGADEELDAYIIIGAYKIGDITIQAFRAWQEDTTEAARLPQKDFYDINISGKADGGRLKYKAEYVVLQGTTPSKGNIQGTAESERADFDAWMYYGDVNYRFDLGTVGFATGAGSGDSNSSDKTVSGFQSLFLDETAWTYNNLFADDLWGYDLNSAGSLNQTTNGFNNVTWYKLYGTVPVPGVSGLSVSPSYSVMAVTENPSGTSGDLYGTEIDVNIDYKINKISRAFMKAAYFEPGDYFSDNKFGDLARPDSAQKIEAGIAIRF